MATDLLQQILVTFTGDMRARSQGDDDSNEKRGGLCICICRKLQVLVCCSANLP